MKKILFLDFDGVLHSTNDRRGNFSRLPYLEKSLARMPDLDIVITSTWRESHGFEELKNLFPAHLRPRIIGKTPVLGRSNNPGGRQREIEAYLAAQSLDQSNAVWIVLDDMGFMFDADCPYLILVDHLRGFHRDDATRLMAWYKTTLSR
ncbi:HAD domain-containing protein [soil metagenome]